MQKMMPVKPSNPPTAVIDVDGTICETKNRDYVNAIPNIKAILRIRELKSNGYKIVLFTSRGMASCGGDIAKIIEKNDKVLRAWLSLHSVPFDELIFGKPLADLYVDDKGMSVGEFERSIFEQLRGGSGCRIDRIGCFVKKNFPGEKETQLFKSWIDENRAKGNVYNSPKIVSYLYDSVTMDYIDGDSLYDSLDDTLFRQLIGNVFHASSKKFNTSLFDVQHHISVLERNLGVGPTELASQIGRRVERCKLLLLSNSLLLRSNSSFCHGDLTLQNILVDKDRKLWFIDPAYSPDASSYLLDFAKLRMSLSGYDWHFGFSERKMNYDSMIESLDGMLKQIGLHDIVLVLQYMYTLRLYRYRKEGEHHKVLNALLAMEAKNAKLFSGD